MAISNAKKAILHAKINDAVVQLLVKTSAEMVYLDDDITLAAKLAEMLTSINDKATPADIKAAIGEIDGTVKAYVDSCSEELANLAELVGELPEGAESATIVAYIGEAVDKAVNALNVSDLSQKVDTLIGTDTGKSVRAIANEELAKQLIPENASEALDTLTEIAAWIQAHPDDATAMNAAIEALQRKAVLGTDSEGQEYATVKAYVEAAIAALSIGDYAKAADLTALAGRVTAVEDKAHQHENAETLASITPEQIAAWNSKGGSEIYYAAQEPAGFKESDLWVQLID